MTTPSRRRTRAAAVAALAAVTLTTLGATSALAEGSGFFDWRAGGAGRVDTAVMTSQALYPDGTKSEDVVLVNERAVVDGLSASYLAGLKNAPILLTGSDSAPEATRKELVRLGAKRVWLVGGTSVLSKDLEKGLSGDYEVKRFSGDDRYGTAAAVAAAGQYQPERVYVVSGSSLADAVAVGPIAWARQYPVLLTKQDAAPEATRKALTALGVSHVTVVGGTAVVSDAQQKAIGADRIAGKNRQQTAAFVADDAVGNEDFTRSNAALVGGKNENAIDALTASALAGNTGTPILFTETPDSIGPVTAQYLKDHASELDGNGYVFGGQAAVSDKAVAQADGAAAGK